MTVKYHLTSEILRQLVTEGKAQYVGVIACDKTFSRNSFAANQEDELYILEAGQFADELKLTPYVVATQGLTGAGVPTTSGDQVPGFVGPYPL